MTEGTKEHKLYKQQKPSWSEKLTTNLCEKSFKELLFFSDLILSLLLDIKKKDPEIPLSVSWTSTWCEVAKRWSLLLQLVSETLLGFLNYTAQLSALSMLTAHQHNAFGNGALFTISLPSASFFPSHSLTHSLSFAILLSLPLTWRLHPVVITFFASSLNTHTHVYTVFTGKAQWKGLPAR